MKPKPACRCSYLVAGIATLMLIMDIVAYPVPGQCGAVTPETAKVRAGAGVRGPGQPGPTGRTSVFLHLEPGADLGLIERIAAERGAIVKYRYKKVMPDVVNLRDVPESAISELESLPGVKRVVEDKYYEHVIKLDESTPLIRALQEQINAAGFNADGSGVRVCICDTGIDMDHIMYADRIDTAASYDFHNDDPNPDDDNGHGAHVAGIAVGGNGLTIDFGCEGQEPFQGVAPKATLIGVKVLDEYGGGFSSNIIAGIDHCADPNLPGGPADVINLSLGKGEYQDTCDDDTWAVAANNAVDAGVVLVAAAGNLGSSNSLSSPACGSKVIAVGATYKDSYPNCEDDSTSFTWCLDGQCSTTCTDTTPYLDDLTCYSNKNGNLDVVAPGSVIWSATNTEGGMAVFPVGGTSMASSHVAGLAALALGMDPSLTPLQVRYYIRGGAIDMGPPGFDPGYGYGRVDAVNTLALLQKETCDNGVDDNFDGQTDCSDSDCFGDPDCCTDGDSDGYYAQSECGSKIDCNDNDPSIHTGASEVCNGKDDDCDQQVDEAVKETYYRDSDGDGVGDPNDTTQACSAPPGYAADGVDNCPNNPDKIEPGVCGCITPDADGDNDGALDCIEDAGPGGGDADGDSISDSQQSNVVSLEAADGQSYATLKSPAGTTIANCQCVGNPSPSDTPADVEFPLGFFRFTLAGVGQGATVSVVINLHGGNAPDTYYKYGFTPGNQSDHWYQFMNDGNTGAEINGTEITLHFVNGGRGDDDLDANNDIIIDVGGPGSTVVQPSGPVAPAPGSGGGGGGGGGCFISTALGM